MKTNLVRAIAIVAGAWISLAAASPVVLGQEGRLSLTHLDKLSSAAVESVDVSFNQTMLEAMALYRASEGPDPVKFKTLLNGLGHVSVRGFRFGRPGEYSNSDVEKAREQLVRDGWKRIVSVQNRRGADNGEMYFRYLNGALAGVTTISAQPQELMIVHVIGDIPIDEISMKEGALGLSRLDPAWSAWTGARSRNDRRSDR